jgi:hypothetical protein
MVHSNCQKNGALLPGLYTSILRLFARDGLSCGARVEWISVDINSGPAPHNSANPSQVNFLGYVATLHVRGVPLCFL